MKDINQNLIDEIVECIKTIKPEKIILFGSYAYGTPIEASDVDLFVIKNVEPEKVRDIRLQVRKMLRGVQLKYKLGFDILVDSEKRIIERIEKIKDCFYKEVLEKGVVIYAK